MVEQETVSQEQTKPCVFDNEYVIEFLSEGRIPKDLEGRIEYIEVPLEDGTTKEVYTDKETGAILFKVNKIFEGFLKRSEIIQTKIGKYETNHFINEFGCTGHRYLFNDIETEKEIFFKILKEQKELALV